MMAAAGLALWFFAALIYCSGDSYLTNRFGIATLFIFPENYFLLAAPVIFALAQYIDPHAVIQSIQGRLAKPFSLLCNPALPCSFSTPAIFNQQL